MFNGSRYRMTSLVVLTVGLGAGAVGVVGSAPVNAATPPVWVSLSPSIGSTDYTGLSVFAGEALQYNLSVSNASDTASAPVTVVDKPPGADATVIATSVTCGSVPNCTFTVTGNAVTFTLSSVEGGASGLEMSFQAMIRSQRVAYDSAKWSGGGCAPWCHANILVNPIVGSPVTLSSNPPNRSFVAAGDQIDYTLTVAPLAYETGASDVVVVDTVPAKTSYLTGSATCGSTLGCTAAEADGIVTFTFTGASFAADSSVDVSFTSVIGKRIGTIKDRGSWTGGTCALLSCKAQPGVDLNAT